MSACIPSYLRHIPLLIYKSHEGIPLTYEEVEHHLKILTCDHQTNLIAMTTQPLINISILVTFLRNKMLWEIQHYPLHLPGCPLVANYLFIIEKKPHSIVLTLANRELDKLILRKRQIILIASNNLLLLLKNSEAWTLERPTYPM